MADVISPTTLKLHVFNLKKWRPTNQYGLYMVVSDVLQEMVDEGWFGKVDDEISCYAPKAIWSCLVKSESFMGMSDWTEMDTIRSMVAKTSKPSVKMCCILDCTVAQDLARTTTFLKKKQIHLLTCDNGGQTNQINYWLNYGQLPRCKAQHVTNLWGWNWIKDVTI